MCFLNARLITEVNSDVTSGWDPDPNGTIRQWVGLLRKCEPPLLEIVW